jgi:hypothetical protein
MRNLIPTRKVASILRLSTRQVTRLVQTGELEPAEKLTGVRGAYLFDEKAVEDLRKRRAA